MGGRVNYSLTIQAVFIASVFVLNGGDKPEQATASICKIGAEIWEWRVGQRKNVRRGPTSSVVVLRVNEGEVLTAVTSHKAVTLTLRSSTIYVHDLVRD